jgi:D-galactarolactone cycloisomerase
MSPEAMHVSTVKPLVTERAPLLPIRGIETILLRVPLPTTFRGSTYAMTHRSTILIRLLSDDGVAGEAYVGDEDATNAEIERIIESEIAPRLVGEDAFAVERCWQIARPATFDILRDRRLGLVATAAVDTAIWDAIGRALNQPLWRLWGGYTNRLPIISAGGYYNSDRSIEEEIIELREQGLAGMKFKVGGLSPKEDAQRFWRARRAAGDDFLLMADANQAWLPSEAIEFARLVEDAQLFWFEEPCRWENDARGMRDVRFTAGVRVCAGQSELSAAGCRNLMIEDAIDVCNFDASWSGGPTEWRRVAAIASTFNVLMAHHEEPHLGSHLLAGIPHGTFVEIFHANRDPVWWNMVANHPEPTDGVIELPEAPGLGWEYDEEFIEKYRLPVDTARQ